MKLGKKLAALGMAASLAAASCMTAFAEDFTVEFNGVFNGAIEETGITLSSQYENPFDGPLIDLYDENVTITMDPNQTHGFTTNPSASWGYLDGQDFVKIASFELGDYMGMPVEKSIETDKAYPVLNPEQLAKDKADGSAYSKTYALLIDGVEATSSSNVCLGYFFRLKKDSAAAAGQADWKQDTKGWWWDNGDGTYPVNQWKEIGGKFYYFGSDGYILLNTTTPDGYQVDASGAWVR